MAKETKEGEVAVIEKVSHKNIFEALAAFQGENPEIIRDKKVVIEKKSGGTFEFMYAPIDSVLKVVRPLLAKHGLSVVHVEGKKEGQMVCALYHETYESANEDDREVRKFDVNSEKPDRYMSPSEIETTYKTTEKNVIRSMPITVRRAGDMKDIGGDSTYARRYTLAEVLGIASDDDNDIADQAERGKAAISSMYERALKGVGEIKTIKQADATIGTMQKGLAAIAAGHTPSLGLDKEQHETLLKLAEEKKIAISESTPSKEDPAAPKVPGENDDNGGAVEKKD